MVEPPVFAICPSLPTTLEPVAMISDALVVPTLNVSELLVLVPIAQFE